MTRKLAGTSERDAQTSNVEPKHANATPNTPDKCKIITSFEELGTLKARSRMPIDIHSVAMATPALAPSYYSAKGGKSPYETLLRSTSTASAQQSSSSDPTRSWLKAHDLNNSIRQRANLAAPIHAHHHHVSASINFSSLMSPEGAAATDGSCPTNLNQHAVYENQSTEQPSVKYFSFMTTNKLFSNYTSQSTLKVRLRLPNALPTC